MDMKRFYGSGIRSSFLFIDKLLSSVVGFNVLYLQRSNFICFYLRCQTTRSLT